MAPAGYIVELDAAPGMKLRVLGSTAVHRISHWLTAVPRSRQQQTNNRQCQCAPSLYELAHLLLANAASLLLSCFYPVLHTWIGLSMRALASAPGAAPSAARMTMLNVS